MTSMLIVGLAGAVIYRRKKGIANQPKKSSESELEEAPSTTLTPKGLSISKEAEFVNRATEITNEKARLAEKAKKDLAIFLESIPKTVIVPQRMVIIKDRQKFFDEWAAEEGGKESIQEMYKKSPSKFSAADVQYLKSKKILI